MGNSLYTSGASMKKIQVRLREIRIRGFAQGGLASSTDGRELGDSILIHINPQQFRQMRATWGDPTLNPHTGLPEYGIPSSQFDSVKTSAAPWRAPQRFDAGGFVGGEPDVSNVNVDITPNPDGTFGPQGTPYTDTRTNAQRLQDYRNQLLGQNAPVWTGLSWQQMSPQGAFPGSDNISKAQRGAVQNMSVDALNTYAKQNNLDPNSPEAYTGYIQQFGDLFNQKPGWTTEGDKAHRLIDDVIQYGSQAANLIGGGVNLVGGLAGAAGDVGSAAGEIGSAAGDVGAAAGDIAGGGLNLAGAIPEITVLGNAASPLASIGGGLAGAGTSALSGLDGMSSSSSSSPPTREVEGYSATAPDNIPEVTVTGTPTTGGGPSLGSLAKIAAPGALGALASSGGGSGVQASTVPDTTGGSIGDNGNYSGSLTVDSGGNGGGGILSRLGNYASDPKNWGTLLKGAGALGSAFAKPNTQGPPPLSGFGSSTNVNTPYTPPAYQPYTGDYYTYGSRPEHNFFSSGAPSAAQTPTSPNEIVLPAPKETLQPVMGNQSSPTATFGGLPAGGHARGNLVKGPGSGRQDKIPAALSDGEYVMDAETVALLGDGSTDEGARKLDAMRKKLRQQKGRNLVKGEFSENAKDPEHYLGGGQ